MKTVKWMKKFVIGLAVGIILYSLLNHLLGLAVTVGILALAVWYMVMKEAQEKNYEINKKQPFVITGSMVTRAVQVLALIVLIGKLVASVLKNQPLDMPIVALMICSLGAMEAGLQGQKKKKQEKYHETHSRNQYFRK